MYTTIRLLAARCLFPHSSARSMSRYHGFDLGSGPASGLGKILVLASLALASGPARADQFRVSGEVRVDDLVVRGGYEQIVTVPRGGLEVELWSDPEAGALVRVGERVQFHFRANADCYVTLISIDGDGRARRLFPQRGDDGWIRGGRVHALPGRWDDFDFRFNGPPGDEYVFAVASLDPLTHRYPGWLTGGSGRSWESCGYRYGHSDLYDTGWCVGDPIPEIYRFVERLVSLPRDRHAYAATWIRFDVGRRHVWHVCNDCGGRHERGRDCGHGSVEIRIGVAFGCVDFGRPCPPRRYRHDVCRTIEPHRWNRVFHEPVGRWRDDDPGRPRPHDVWGADDDRGRGRGDHDHDDRGRGRGDDTDERGGSPARSRDQDGGRGERDAPRSLSPEEYVSWREKNAKERVVPADRREDERRATREDAPGGSRAEARERKDSPSHPEERKNERSR